MSTLLVQIEACLNSRPLQSLTDDPTDLTALTPAHFLMGRSTLTVPQLSVLGLTMNRLSRRELLRQMYEDFWKRWSSEYLHELQQRPKWRTRKTQVTVGDLCVIRNSFGSCKSRLRLRPLLDRSLKLVCCLCSVPGEGGRNVPDYQTRSEF